MEKMKNKATGGNGGAGNSNEGGGREDFARS